MLDVVCVLRKGGKVNYSRVWVRKLRDACRRNLKIDHNFYCLSDCPVSCDRIPLDNEGPGFWSKIQLFKPGLFTNQTLYIDLDTVICNNITPIVQLVEGKKFVMWCEEDRAIHSSALMYWEGDHSYIWEKYKEHPIEYWQELYKEPPKYGDQALISEITDHELFTDICPQEWFYIMSKKDYNRWTKRQIPFTVKEELKFLMSRDLRVKPPDMIKHPLIQKHWR